MKNKIFLSIIFTICTISLNAQLTNDGATIYLRTGATLNIDGNFTNNSGTINLESGSLINITQDFYSEDVAVINADDNSTIEFTSSDVSYIKSGGDNFGILSLKKDNGVDLKLIDDMEISNNLNFNTSNVNKLIIGQNDIILDLNTTISNYDSDHYIQADSNGIVIKNVDIIGNYFFPIGDINNYVPVNANIQSGTFNSNSKISINTKNTQHPSIYSDADSYLARYWNCEVTNITNPIAQLTCQYVDGDIVGNESKLTGAAYTTEWNFYNSSADNINNNISIEINNNSAITGMNFYGKLLSLKAFLQSAFNGTDMSTTLNTLNLIPLTSPYGTGDVVSAIPTGITDWIKIEIRDDNDPSTILKTYSKFIMNNGFIVESDGISTPRFKDSPTSGYIAIRHRNHLGIRTNASINLNNNSNFDFTTSPSLTYGTNSMKELSSGIWGMIGGNTNNNVNIRYLGPSNDNNYLLNTILNGNKNSVLNNVYNDGDLNMNGTVRYLGTNNDNNFLLNTILEGDKNNVIFEQL
ncbi:MAG: hypothetical protein R2771_16250 [Saprospiraceae bacterium]